MFDALLTVYILYAIITLPSVEYLSRRSFLTT